MDTLKNLTRQYHEACINFAQLLQLWESTFRDTQALDREEKLQEYWIAMEAMEQKLMLLEGPCQTDLLDKPQASPRPSAAA
jgi:hypothetical protein